MEQVHRRAICKRNTIKLYRYYAYFLRDDEIFCKTHAPPGHIERQILVPLIEDDQGFVWGYTAVPQAAIEQWNKRED